NYTRYPLYNLPYPAMTQGTEGSGGVHGSVTDVNELSQQTGIPTDKIVARLDEFEGNQYRRILVDVEAVCGAAKCLAGCREKEKDGIWNKYSKDTTSVKAWAYEWIAGERHLIKDQGDWSYDEFVATKLASYL
ncbi:UNVERIFIED_CONTAM: hypothetical protein HDU68_006120, partial [Siphonaria sp. JEL0065]